MNFSRKFTNKLVSYADRHYTYDRRYMKREGDKTYWGDFFAINHDNHTSIGIERCKLGMWVSIKKDGTFIIAKHLRTYKEVDDFKRMIRCIG